MRHWQGDVSSCSLDHVAWYWWRALANCFRIEHQFGDWFAGDFLRAYRTLLQPFLRWKRIFYYRLRLWTGRRKRVSRWRSWFLEKCKRHFADRSCQSVATISIKRGTNNSDRCMIWLFFLAFERSEWLSRTRIYKLLFRFSGLKSHSFKGYQGISCSEPCTHRVQRNWCSSSLRPPFCSTQVSRYVMWDACVMPHRRNLCRQHEMTIWHFDLVFLFFFFFLRRCSLQPRSHMTNLYEQPNLTPGGDDELGQYSILFSSPLNF